MKFELNEDNFLIFAIKHYDNPHCAGMKEFLDDLQAFKYLKRLFKRYKATGVLKERLIINHLVVLYNLFGPEAATQMLFYKLDKDYWSMLKTFLIYLNFMPLEMIMIDGSQAVLIPIDQKIAAVLRKL